jgi:hypothetical protein
MMKRLCGWLAWAGLACLILGATAGYGQATAGAQASCPRVAARPVLDGRMEDWPPLPQVVMVGPEEWHPTAAEYADYGGPEDLSGEVRMAWDSRALYVAVVVRDDVLARVQSASEIDRGDSVVLSVAGEEAGEGDQFVVAVLEATSLVWRAQPAGLAGELRNVDLGISVEAQDDGQRVIYELALPWSELAPMRPLPGSEFTLTVSLCDDDGEGLRGCLEHSVGVGLSAGEMSLVSQPPPRPALAPEFAAPEAARFDRKCFWFAGQEAVIFGGEIDYAGLPREAWGERVALLKAAGMNTVAIAARWAEHQPTPGLSDLTALREFLDLCGEARLWVQLNVGPYAGERWEAGGVPGWAVGLESADQEWEAVRGWYEVVLPVVKAHQVTVGGPIATVVVRGLPDLRGRVEASALERLVEMVRAAGVEVPVLTANAPAARDNTKQVLANLLDTVSFYEPPAAGLIVGQLRALGREENGPAVVSGIRGDYGGPEPAGGGLGGAIRAALGQGAAAVVLSEFAPGLDATAVRAAGEAEARGAVDAAGARLGAYQEARLVGSMLRQFGRQLARALSVEGLVQVDDPEVGVAVRLSRAGGFIFLCNGENDRSRQVRLTYTDPETDAAVPIPEAGAIALGPGEGKIVITDLPLGRGKVRYCTSEIVGLHRVGERILMMVCGAADTAGEIALQWPGRPLVRGEVARQRWDQGSNTLILDYYHSEADRHLLVDELEIAILSRARAAMASAASSADDTVIVSGGAEVAGATLGSSAAKAVVECPAGKVDMSAVLPRSPSAVTVDGRPVEFALAAPERVVRFQIATEEFEKEQRPRSVLEGLGRALLGGPPKLRAEFDRGWFMPDAAAGAKGWRSVGSPGRGPEAFGLKTGGFGRLRARFDPGGRKRMTIAGSSDPTLVFVNGEYVAELSGSASEREADVSGLLLEGENRVELVVHILPRAPGHVGLRSEVKRLPAVRLTGESGEMVVGNWEAAEGLAGESAGWQGLPVDTRRWHFVRFGPWREQGRDLAEVRGVGWYRVPFGLPRAGEWRIPYRALIDLSGTAAVYLNGALIATCQGNGRYLLPLPSELLVEGGENVLSLAVYGLSPDTGVGRVEVRAEEERMARRRVVEIRF